MWPINVGAVTEPERFNGVGHHGVAFAFRGRSARFGQDARYKREGAR